MRAPNTFPHLRFGVEIEVCSRYSSRKTAERLEAETGIVCATGSSRLTAWSVGIDTSIEVESHENQCELRTPIFKLGDPSFAAEVAAILRTMRKFSHPNHSCGLHVHASLDAYESTGYIEYVETRQRCMDKFGKIPNAYRDEKFFNYVHPGTSPTMKRQAVRAIDVMELSHMNPNDTCWWLGENYLPKTAPSTYKVAHVEVRAFNGSLNTRHFWHCVRSAAECVCVFGP